MRDKMKPSFFTRISHGIIASALGNGSLLRRSRWVDHRTDLAALSVRAYGPVPYQVDGDHLGDTERLELRHEPEAIDLVLPRTSPHAT